MYPCINKKWIAFSAVPILLIFTLVMPVQGATYSEPFSGFANGFTITNATGWVGGKENTSAVTNLVDGYSSAIEDMLFPITNYNHETQNKILQLNTMGSDLINTVAATDFSAAPAYVDMMISFAPGDDAGLLETLAYDATIKGYVFANESGNLVVYCGSFKYDGSGVAQGFGGPQFLPATTQVVFGVWHRLTIQCETATSGAYQLQAFKVLLDGVPLTSAKGYPDNWASAVTAGPPSGGAWFLSAANRPGDNGSEAGRKNIGALFFKGGGMLDDLVAGNDAPVFYGEEDEDTPPDPPQPSEQVAILALPYCLAVPADGTAKFRLSLSDEPTGTVTVAVQRDISSSDVISIVGTPTLTFTPENWFVWQSVTLAAGPNLAGTRETTVFNCTGSWGSNTTVLATQMRSDTLGAADSDSDGLPDTLEEMLGRDQNTAEAPAEYLPLVERFESDTVHPGQLHGQNHWVVNSPQHGQVQDTTVYQGDGALTLLDTGSGPAIASRTFKAHDTVLWLDAMMQVQAGEIPATLPDMAVVCMFDNTGHLLVCDGSLPPNQEWVALTNSAALPANSWARVTARIDYATQTWDAYLNGTLLAVGLGFAAPQAQPSLLVAQGSEASFDNIYLGHTMPTGIPVSPMWMIENFGHAMVDENNDSDSDGFTNLEENLAGTDPLDPSSKLELLEIESGVSNTYEVTWRSVAGRTYTLLTSTNLVNGFDTILATGIRATPPTNTFNDQIQSVSGKLYKVVLETP